MFPVALICFIQTALPAQAVERDNVVITQSCNITVPPPFIADADDNGVIQITADDLTIDFAGQVLRGADPTSAPDKFSGIGIRITGKNVTLKNAVVAGFKCGIWATGADGLTLDNCDVSDNYAQRLKSTPNAEDGADWLFPHQNDQREWTIQHGAGVSIDRCTGITVRNCRARRTQNGLLLDRVAHANIYDNDFSFLSGWGLGMWRCEDNLISRNAFDFCVRGYSHGVYNRGQDSAGILFFEQNHRNVLVENSATHGGDGFFAFAGREALGEAWWDEQRARLRKDLSDEGIKAARERLVAQKGEEWKKRSDDDVIDQQIVVTPEVIEKIKRRGNGDNILAENDFSYAPAHGIELTFSFGNVLYKNRLTENGICGVWGGYSQDTLIVENTFERNGQAGYGMERGGVNIEHGRGNVIRNNTFSGNSCGVHLWWDADEGLLRFPWARANGAESADNIVIGNDFTGDDVALHLRQSKNTIFANNRLTQVKKDVEATPGSEPVTDISRMRIAGRDVPKYEAIGDKRPVGARQELRGRDKIIITDRGPYDWTKPYLQLASTDATGHVYRVLGKEPLVSFKAEGDVTATRTDKDGVAAILVSANRENAVVPYELSIKAGASDLTARNVAVNAAWTVSMFKNAGDPRKDYDAWRREAQAASAVTWPWFPLDLRYGNGGPGDLPQLGKMKDAPVAALRELGRDHFGTLATTSLSIPAGKWQLTIASDDGVRAYVDDKLLIDDWTWHAPRTESKELTLEKPATVNLRIEHFELDGYAALSVQIEPAE